MAVTAFIGGGLRLEFFDSATSISSTITAPANIIAGDFLALLDMSGQSAASPPSAAVPTGFTTIIETSLSNHRIIFSGKIAAGTEGGTSLTGMAGTLANSTSKTLIVFRGTKSITAFNVESINEQMTTGDPSEQTVTSSSGAAPLIALGLYGKFTFPSAEAISPSFSPTQDAYVENQSGGSQLTGTIIGYKIMNSAGQLANVAVDMPDAVSAADVNGLQSCYIEFSAD